MFRRFKLIKQLAQVGVLALISAQSAWGLPDEKADISGLTKAVSLEGIGPVMGDKEDRHALYVMPGTLKFNGKFYQTNGTMNCLDLFRLRENTYRMPAPEEFQGVIDSNRFYSPAFDSKMGVAARNSNVLRQILEQKRKVSEYVDTHHEIYGSYVSSEAAYTLAKADLDTINEEIKELREHFVTTLALENDEARKNQLIVDFKANLTNLVAKKEQINAYEIDKREKFHKALENWAPYKDELKWLTDVEANLTQSFNQLQSVSDRAFSASEELIRALETKVVGYASTGFALSPDKEVAMLNKRIAEQGVSYHAQALPVFNVRLNPGVTKNINKVKDGLQGLDYELVTYHMPSDTQVTLGTSKSFVQMPMQLQQNGKAPEQVKFLMADMDGSFGGAESFEMPVTQGAVCGYPTTETVNYDVKDSDNHSYSRTVTTVRYQNPEPNRPIFVQNVALRYNYYKAAEPLSGSCSLDVNKTSTYVRNAGYEKSWSWFSVNTHTWDDTKKTMTNDMGLTCMLKQRPQGATPEEAKEKNIAFEKALYQDIFNMFIVTYAKEYEVTPIKPELLSTDSRFFRDIGNSVMSLCGPNLYCQVGGIVLKALDDLVGERHTGTTSDSTTVKGVLKREAYVDGYLISEGQTNIEMRVCLDYTRCAE